MALKKPSDYFNKNNPTVSESVQINNTEVLSEFSNTLSNYRANIERVDHLSSEIKDIKNEVETLLRKEDLDNALVSQLLVVDEIVADIQRKVKSINEKKLTDIRLEVSTLSESVNNFIEVDVPKYKKLVVDSEIRTTDRYEELEENVSHALETIGEFVDVKYQELTESLQGINEQNLAEILEDFKVLEGSIKNFKEKDIPKYKSFIVEAEKKTESKLEEFGELVEEKLDVVEDKLDAVENTFDNKFNSLNEKFSEITEQEIPKYKGFIVETEIKTESKLKEFQESLDETLSNIIEKVNLVEGDKENLVNIINEKVDEVKSLVSQVNITEQNIQTQKEFIKKRVADLEVDILRNENHIKVQNENLKTIQEEVKESLTRINLEEIEKQNHRLGEKIKYLDEVFDKFSEKEILTENIITELPSTNNTDPLTPLDQNFVTLDQLQQHYRLFINRIQQQLSSIGGGGETRLEFLDDVDRDSAKTDGKFLKYDSSTGKWIGGDAGSSLTVTEVPSQGGAATTSVNNVTEIQFNNGAGFSVSDEGSGVAFVDLGSTFNPWYIDGQDTLKANGEEPIEFVAGPGIAITTKAVASVGIGTTFSKAITISSNLNPSPWVDANPGIYTTGNVAIGTDVVSTGSTTLWVQGDARVTGILSVGQGTVTIDGNTNTVNTENLTVTSSFTGPGGVGFATEGYVDTAIANLVDGAPEALDTLNELAAALNDDENFATTVTNSLALKANIDNASFTGITTTQTLNVGVGGTIITTTGTGSVGIGSTQPGSTLVVSAPSGYTGNLLDLQVGGSSKLKFNELGYGVNGSYRWGVQNTQGSTTDFLFFIKYNTHNYPGCAFGDIGATPTFAVDTRGIFGWANSNSQSGQGVKNLAEIGTRLYRDATGIIGQRNGSTPNTFRVYNTYTTATNFERGQVGWTTDTFIVGTEKGVDGGSPRQLELQTDGTTRVAITTDGYVGIGSTQPTATLDVNGDVNITGVVTATSYNGSGINLSGIVTYITAGSGISVNQNTGNVTITATGGGGGGSSGVEILDSGSVVGSAITAINFNTNLSATINGTTATINASASGGGGDNIITVLSRAGAGITISAPSSTLTIYGRNSNTPISI